MENDVPPVKSLGKKEKASEKLAKIDPKNESEE
jgi:hypothetical protein